MSRMMILTIVFHTQIQKSQFCSSKNSKTLRIMILTIVFHTLAPFFLILSSNLSEWWFSPLYSTLWHHFFSFCFPKLSESNSYHCIPYSNPKISLLSSKTLRIMILTIVFRTKTKLWFLDLGVEYNGENHDSESFGRQTKISRIMILTIVFRTQIHKISQNRRSEIQDFRISESQNLSQTSESQDSNQEGWVYLLNFHLLVFEMKISSASAPTNWKLWFFWKFWAPERVDLGVE